MHLQVCGGEEKGRNTRVLAHLTGRGRAWRGMTMVAGVQRVCE
jgi:hypothetical protein